MSRYVDSDLLPNVLSEEVDWQSRGCVHLYPTDSHQDVYVPLSQTVTVVCTHVSYTDGPHDVRTSVSQTVRCTHICIVQTVVKVSLSRVRGQ